MNVTVTGANGFVGTALTRKLLNAGYAVHALGRHPGDKLPPNVRFSTWNSEAGPPPRESIASADAIIHLAGEPISQRWTPEVKERIRSSRIDGTRNLVAAIAALPRRPQVLLSASAIGIYGSRGDEILTEWSKLDDSDFLARIAAEWEQAAEAAQELGVRVVRLRLAMVLGKEGALAKMAPAARRGLIGRIGSGKQWASWIHIDDLTDLILFALKNVSLRGPVNASAPNPVTNAELMKELCAAVGRPAIFPVPLFLVNLALGEMGSVALASQRVIPQAAQAAGFRFEYTHIRPALDSLLS